MSIEVREQDGADTQIGFATDAPDGFESAAGAFSSLGSDEARLGGDAIGQQRAAAEPDARIATANPLIMDLPVVMKVVLGSAKMALASVARLSKGSIIRLDKKVGEPVDVFVNGRLIARGEVVVIDQEANRFGIVLTQVGGLTAAGSKSS